MTTKDDKDRFGEKLKEAERAREDQFFAERDRKLLAKLRHAKESEGKAVLKEAAHMRCPKCGVHLQHRTIHEIRVAECPDCHGVWLDQGALGKISERETDGWIARWLRVEFPQDV
jgi:predicted Zn-ribbon and HTH transcriptional regulator